MTSPVYVCDPTAAGLLVREQDYGPGDGPSQIRDWMRTAHTLIPTATLVAVLAGVACGARSAEPQQAGPSPGPDASAVAGMEELFWARQDSARTRYVEADVRFMSGMIGHHVQAIVMARLAPDRARSPSIRTLAARIINAQEDEIALMERWLRDRGRPVPEIQTHGTTLVIHGPGHEGHVPGMLSQEQMARLEEATGTDFDRLFLTYMIQHHRGAVVMVHELLATDGAAQDPDVFRFASDVQVDQATEIARMERMLAELAARDTIR